MKKLSIVVAGHTNTGKTTLIRTFMKSRVGEVADRANVTKRSGLFEYTGLQADFIDTPGFQVASYYNMYLDMAIRNPGFSVPNEWKEKTQLDVEAVNAIRSSNVVLYVGSLSVVPDESHAEEIKLTRRIQPQIVGILNFGHITSRSVNVEDRIILWKKLFYDNAIDHFVVFDAHWDKYSKVNTIYEKIGEVVSKHEKEIFSEGLDRFRKRQSAISREACNLLTNCVVKVRGISHEFKKMGYSEEDAKQKIGESLKEVVSDFINQITKLYEIASEDPTASIESIRVKLDPRKNWRSRFGMGARTATFGAGGGTAVGAIVGAVLAGYLTGGLAAVAGATLGAQIGGAIGGGLGILSTFDSSEDTVVITLESHEMREISQQLIAVIWGLSMVGYGRDRELSKDEVADIEKHVKTLFDKSELSGDDWENADAELIRTVSFNILNKLKKYW